MNRKGLAMPCYYSVWSRLGRVKGVQKANKKKTCKELEAMIKPSIFRNCEKADMAGSQRLVWSIVVRLWRLRKSQIM